MAASGCTSDQIAAVVQRTDEARRAKARDGNRQRQADFRARKRNADNGVTGRDEPLSAVTGRDNRDGEPSRTPARVLCGEEVVVPPQTATLSSAPKWADDRKRGRRLSEVWQPKAEHRAHGLGLGLTEGQFEEIVAEFKNYWLSESGGRARKLDWDRTFLNRLNDRAKWFLKNSGKINGKRTVHEAARDLHERVSTGIVSLGEPPAPFMPHRDGDGAQSTPHRLLSQGRG